MHVAFDGRRLANRRGMGNYLFHLLQAFARIPKPFDGTVYVDCQEAEEAVPKASFLRVVNLGRGTYATWEQARLPRAVFRDRPDILHAPANTCPFFLPKKVRLIVTLHDAMFCMPLGKSPILRQRLGRLYYRATAAWAARHATKIITVSQHSAGDLKSFLNIGEERLSVIHEAPAIVSSQSQEESLVEGTLEKYQIRHPFMLHLAAIDPRKNTGGVIDAFARAAPTLPKECILVLVGVQGEWAIRLEDECKKKNIGERVKLLAFVSDKELFDLYRAAELFLFPSKYEGFGLPALEAMAAGTPVITSNVSSMPEVAGDAACLVDPENIEEMAAALKKIWGDKNVAKDLQIRGRERAATFTWQRTAEQTLDVYREALKE